MSIRGEDAFRTLVLIRRAEGCRTQVHVRRAPAHRPFPHRARGSHQRPCLGAVWFGRHRRRDQRDHQEGRRQAVQGEAAVTYSGASEGFTESLSLYGSSNGFNYRVAGSNTNNGNVRTPIGTMPNTKFKQKDGSAFLSYDFSDKFTAGVSFDYFDGNSIPPIWRR